MRMKPKNDPLNSAAHVLEESLNESEEMVKKEKIGGLNRKKDDYLVGGRRGTESKADEEEEEG